MFISEKYFIFRLVVVPVFPPTVRDNNEQEMNVNSSQVLHPLTIIFAVSLEDKPLD